MTLIAILGSASIVASIALLWWGVTSRPSAARANLFAGLAQLSDERQGPPPLLERLGRSTRRLMPKPLLDGLETNLVQAGHPRGLDLPRILGLKFTLAGVSAVLLLIAGQVGWAFVATFVMYFLPDYWVLTMKDKRQAAIQAEMADTIDQLTICVEAGLGFDGALARVATSRDGVLAQEFRRTIGDIQAGVPRAQALRMLADRAQVTEIRQLVSALLQAQKHGVPLAETLRTQSAEMRIKRKQRTEEKAAKLTVKMLFPVVVCFMPVFMIVTVGPALIGLGENL